MRGALNIYKLSGVPRANVANKAIKDFGKYKYWNAESVEVDNTIAENYLLSLVNLKICEAENIPQTDAEYIKTLNELDLYIVALEALFSARADVSLIMRTGAVLDAMITKGSFSSDIIKDEERSVNLDKILAEFWAMFDAVNLYDFSDVEFFNWWQKNVVETSYNAMSVEEKERYISYFSSNKVGAISTNSEGGMAEEIINSGSYFLYIFIGDEEIKKYNSKIQKRYKKEVEMYEWCCTMLNGMYSPSQVLTLARTGVTKNYKATPERVIENLNKGFDGGKIGVADPISWTIEAIIALVSAILTFLASMIASICAVVQKKYEQPKQSESGVPQGEDWGNRINLNDENKNSSSTVLLVGGVALLGYYLYSKN